MIKSDIWDVAFAALPSNNVEQPSVASDSLPKLNCCFKWLRQLKIHRPWCYRIRRVTALLLYE